MQKLQERMLMTLRHQGLAKKAPSAVILKRSSWSLTGGRDSVCWLREHRLNIKLTLYLTIDSEM